MSYSHLNEFELGWIEKRNYGDDIMHGETLNIHLGLNENIPNIWKIIPIISVIGSVQVVDRN